MEVDHYPMPIIANVTSLQHSTKIFSKLNLLKGYYQVKLRTEVRRIR